MRKLLKDKKGITLIALVVTIIVLLILAGVSISMLTGDSGLLTQAEDAKIESRAGTVQEQVDLWRSENGIKNYKGDILTSEEELLNDLKAKKYITENEIDRDNKIIKIGSHEISYEDERFGIKAEVGYYSIKIYPIISEEEQEKIFIEICNEEIYKDDPDAPIFTSVNEIVAYEKKNGHTNADNIEGFLGELGCSSLLSIFYKIYEIPIGTPPEKYNITINCSNGERKTINILNSEYAVFRITEAGTYTFNTTLGGQRATTKISVTSGELEDVTEVFSYTSDGYINGLKATCFIGGHSNHNGTEASISKKYASINNTEIAVMEAYYVKEEYSYLKIPNQINETKIIGINDTAFFKIENLKKVEIENGITTIGKWAFGFCFNLQEVIIPNTVTSIAEGGFLECGELKKCILPDALESIGIKAFAYCFSIKDLRIPLSVTSIGNDAFFWEWWGPTQTIYCVAPSKPSGWSNSWYTSAIVVWDCDNVR